MPIVRSCIHPRDRSSCCRQNQNDRARSRSQVGVNGAPKHEPSRIHFRSLTLPQRAHLPAGICRLHYQRRRVAPAIASSLHQVHMGHLRLWSAYVRQALPLSRASWAATTRGVPGGMRSQRMPVAKLLSRRLRAMLAKATSTLCPTSRRQGRAFTFHRSQLVSTMMGARPQLTGR